MQDQPAVRLEIGQGRRQRGKGVLEGVLEAAVLVVLAVRMEGFEMLLWLGGCLQMPQSRKTLSSFILQSFGLGRGGLGATLAYDVLGAA